MTATLTDTDQAVLDTFIAASDRAYASIELHDMASEASQRFSRDNEAAIDAGLYAGKDRTALDDNRRLMLASQMAADVRRAAEKVEADATRALWEMCTRTSLDETEMKALVGPHVSANARSAAERIALQVAAIRDGSL